MQATINDVARSAGVSKATVSKCLNGVGHVSKATKARIAVAVEQLRYEPNRVAQGLTLKRSHTIGLIVADVSNTFYGELIRGAEDIASARGFTVLLASTDGEPARETAIVKAMRQRQVDGIAFASVRLADREVTTLAHLGTRIVLASRHLPEAEVDMVLVDNRRGAALAVEHLLAHGHKRIAYIGGPQSIASFADRLSGWRDALAAAGIPLQPDLCVSTEKLDLAAGDAATCRLLELSDPPTAIFAASDNLAFGVLRACDRLGRTVPNDVALVGFDNVPFGEVALSPLTTIDGGGRDIGRCAMRLLIDRIEGQLVATMGDRVKMVLEPKLCIRRSCGCRPGYGPG